MNAFISSKASLLGMIWLLLLGATAQEITTPASAENTGFLARLERRQPPTKVCVLVSNGGNYQLERSSEAENEVYLGSLSASELASFTELLNVEALNQLSQDQIRTPTVVSDPDLFVITDYRPGRFRKVLFPDRTSRKPYLAAVDPLMHWLDTIQAQPHRRVGEQNASNCSLAPPPAKKSSYIAILETEHIRGHVESSCVIVYRDGQYHRENSTRDFGEKMKSKIFEGSIGLDQVRKLHQLLDVKELRDLQQGIPPSIVSHESELLRLTVPREESTQRVVSGNFFGIRQSSQVSGQNMRHFGFDQNTPEFKAVRQWFKANVEQQEGPPLPGMKPSRCVPLE